MDRPLGPLLLPVATSTLFVGFAIAAAFGLVHAEQRRERRRTLHAARSLIARLESFLAGRLDAATLRRTVRATKPARFWSAIESLPLETRRVWRRRLGDALAGNAHAHRERRALSDDSPWRRELAARRLGRLEEPASRRALRRALERAPDAATEACIVALGRCRDGPALRRLLDHPHLLVRRGARAGVTLLRAWGRAALPALSATLARGVPDPLLERALLEVLGLGRHAAAAGAMARALASPDREVRVAAARALGRLGDRAADLERALADPEWPVRATAAWALGHVGDPAVAPALAACLTDRTWWVRRHAAHALWELGEEGRAALREVADRSPDPYARDMAREALGSGESLDAA